MKPLLALILLCAAFDAWGQSLQPSDKACHGWRIPTNGGPITCTSPTAQELRDAAMLRELRAMRNDVRRLESLLKARPAGSEGNLK